MKIMSTKGHKNYDHKSKTVETKAIKASRKASHHMQQSHHANKNQKLGLQNDATLA